MINNVCILGANFATGNLGVGALAMGTIKCVNYAHPKARIFIMDYSVRGDMYHCRVNDRVVDVPLVNIRYSWKLFLPNNIVTLLALAFLARIAPGERLGRFIIRHNRCLRQLRETDLVASLAGGDSFSDIYGFGRFIYVILPQFLALLIGRKLVQTPQTNGPLFVMIWDLSLTRSGQPAKHPRTLKSSARTMEASAGSISAGFS